MKKWLVYVSLGLLLLHCQGKSSNPPSSAAVHLKSNPIVLVDGSNPNEVFSSTQSMESILTVVSTVSLLDAPSGGEAALFLASSLSISDTAVAMASNTATDVSIYESTNSMVHGTPASISGLASIDWVDMYPLTLQLILDGTQTQTKTFSLASGGAAMSIPFAFTEAFEGQSYRIQNVDSLEVTCASLPSGTISSAENALSLSCTKTLVGKVLSAVRIGDNETLSTILSADTTGVVTSLIPSVGIYAQAPLFSPGNTTVYLYAAYLLEQSNLPILPALNTALKMILNTAFMGKAVGDVSFTTDSVNHIITIKLPNKAAGMIPSAIGNLCHLTEFYVDNTLVSGSIPINIGSLTQLKKLQITLNQNMSGSIPASIGNLTKLETLLLKGNKLSGMIPSSIWYLKPTLMNLSGNSLSVCIPPLPDGISTKNDAISFLLNRDLGANETTPTCDMPQ